MLLLAIVAGLLSPLDASAAKQLNWSKRLRGCEPPAVFYSSNHRPGRTPCCPVVEGVCAGGGACPASGMCTPGGPACLPGPVVSRPNVVLLIADDQGECHWGTAGECRSVQTGTPIPPPSTPSLDLLSGYGTVFPIAHNTASWCFPSLDSMLTGRYARNYGGGSHIADRLTTIPKALRSLGGTGGAPADPYNAGNVVGGYCTFLGGKFAGSVGDHGFDAVAKGRRLGRTTCAPGAGGSAPRCGSETSTTYAPTTIFNMEDLFEFLESLMIRVPGTEVTVQSVDEAQYTMQHFFAWVAPRIPHQPLSSPPEIETYLFGSVTPPAFGGLFKLGNYCAGSSCAPVVSAFNESNFGTERAFYANMWWMDDAIREVRRYLASAGTPHCIDSYGQGRYDVTNPASCQGTWASEVSPDPARNTVLIYLTDNGWFLPNSKHAYTENGYRTRLLVFDPRALPTVPGWDPTGQTPPPVHEVAELAHSTDVLPTALGYALDAPGSQPCPVAQDGTRCDGHDLRPYLSESSPGGAFAPLRHSLCGHQTQRPTAPTKLRYLLTRQGSVGRCIDLAAPACADDTACAAGTTCIGGHCATSASPSCSSGADCAADAVCLGGRCRPAPTCIDDAACADLFPHGSPACVEKETKWCRNAPGVRCGTHADCPACPAGPGSATPPCGRVCLPQQLKLYVAPGGASGAKAELTDLFLDPDEQGLHSGNPGTLVDDMSKTNGRYASTITRLNCCVDDWWPDPALQGGTLCAGGCPADFTCNQ
jgi:Sulfatase